MASRFGWHHSWNLPMASYLDRALVPVAPAKSYLAAFGAVYLGVKATQALLCLTRGFTSYFLAGPLKMAVDLRKAGEWAVITGASDGIGKEYALQLAAKGLNIVLIARNQDKTENVAQEIRNVHKVLAKVIVVDFTNFQPDDVKNIQEQLRTLRIAILINNVGVYPTKERFLACPTTDEKAIETVATNITSVVLMTRAILPLLLSQGKGYILNMSSCLSEKPVLGSALYSSSKTFVDFFSKALDYEYRDKGITVQSVICGMVRTNMLSTDQHKNPFTVDAADLVRSALALVGVRQRHHGHWRHALMVSASADPHPHRRADALGDTQIVPLGLVPSVRLLRMWDPGFSSHLTSPMPYINLLHSH